MPPKVEPRRLSRVTLSALIIAAIPACLTLAIEQVDVLSANPLLAAAQKVGMAMILPGLFGSMIVAGNVHAFSLLVAAIVNAILYFSLAWLCLTVILKVQARSVKPG